MQISPQGHSLWKMFKCNHNKSSYPYYLKHPSLKFWFFQSTIPSRSHFRKVMHEGNNNKMDQKN